MRFLGRSTAIRGAQEGDQWCEDGGRAIAEGRGNTETVRERAWVGLPLAVRVIVGAAVAVFAYGTAVHVDQLAAGAWHPYRGLPGWLAGYFVSLTVLDPVAAGLLACRRRAGLLLGCAVLLSDAAGNGYVNYAVRPGQGITAGRAGQAVVTVLAVALLAVAPRIWPWLRPSSRAVPRYRGPLAGSNHTRRPPDEG
jgi:hypothetical protein